MPNLTLRPITKDNWRDCINLKVHDEQLNFVATNARSLVQAHYETQWNPLAIYVDEQMVGFIMYGLEHYQGKDVWDFIRVMVDQRFQKNGYGRQAIQQVLHVMQQEIPDVEDVYISFVPENDSARHVYSKVGFREVGLSPDGSEVLMHKKLSQS